MQEISNTPFQYLYVVRSMYVMRLLPLTELVHISLMHVGRPVWSWGLRSWDTFQCGGLRSGSWSSSLPCCWGLGAKRIEIDVGPCNIAASGISCPWLLCEGCMLLYTTPRTVPLKVPLLSFFIAHVVSISLTPSGTLLNYTGPKTPLFIILWCSFANSAFQNLLSGLLIAS